MRSLALFDLDGTLVRLNSLQSFLDFYRLSVDSRMPSWSEFSQVAARFTDRERKNVAYYSLWKNQSQNRVLEAGSKWFQLGHSAGDIQFISSTYSRFLDHRERGDLVVVVSGSFFAPVLPITAHLGIDKVLCTQLEVKDGNLTGNVLQCMIGESKRLAALRLISESAEEFSGIYAYGDHESDLPLLSIADEQFLVGKDLDRLLENRGKVRLLSPDD